MGIKITDTVLRDSHQSLLATRMRTEDMLPICEALDAIGYHSLEIWGGATFDTCLRFLHEDPWERLRQIKARLKKTPTQMLLRGQNAVGYRHYADDVVNTFCEKAVENGMDIFRIFDAVNDVRNLETAMRAVKRAGGHVQGTICYTVSPVFDADVAVTMGKELVQMGADTVCLKDMAGLLDPFTAGEIIGKLRRALDVPLQLHSHCTSGFADMAYIKAIEAGVDIVDTAISTLSHGTSQPPTETLVATLRGTKWDTGLDLNKLNEIAEYFAGVRKKYEAFESESFGVDAGVLIHQMPGGMISNMINQLREQNALDRLDEVLAEMPRVRKDMGYPPLVTPTSQIVGTQAVMNVLAGEPYKRVTRETRQYFQGFYGRAPAPVNEEVQHKVVDHDQPIISDRPADHIAPELAQARAEIGDLARSEEDVISFALFPQPARDFFTWRNAGDGPEPALVAAIAAALAAEAEKARPAAPPDGHANGRSAWKLAGRQRGLRAR
ncbi:MAG TPA: pyruvate carboxylase subunit B [Dehalococcoidia bacterium]|nr:pyruvate carboxylase subunit B [Dehalococcoidia bacterium]